MNLKKTDLIALYLIKEYIDLNYKKEITIQALSRICQLNPAKLQFGFKELFNKPIYTYITDLRMSNAASLLINTELSIKQIALEVGYRKSKTFSPRFKNFHKLTPTGYRRSRTV